MERQLEVQKFHYFDEGNLYAGEKVKDEAKGLLLRYYVAPDKEAALFHVYAWQEDVCFEKAQEKEGRDFPFSEEGLEQARDWLEERYAAL